MANILVVDDSDFMRLRCRAILEKDGFEVFEAGNGQQALELYPDLKPDLTLMDITMPGMDGIETVRQLKKLDPTVKVIMISSLGHDSLIMEALTAGAKEFVIKPFDPIKLGETIRKLLAK